MFCTVIFDNSRFELFSTSYYRPEFTFGPVISGPKFLWRPSQLPISGNCCNGQLTFLILYFVHCLGFDIWLILLILSQLS